MSLKDKVVVVTGAASGIGLSTAIHFLSQGARVVFADINLEKLKKALADHGLSPEGDILTVKCDVSREESVEQLFQLALAKFGYVDSVVNNAGLMIFKPLEQHTHEDWTRILSVDLLGAFFFTRQAFLHMSRGGSIINVSSIHAVETTPMVSSYAAAKAALLSLTRSAAIEGKPKGIRVNAVLPGAIDTPMLWENPNIKSGLEVIDKSDVGKPENLAAVIAFLASDEAAFVQGAAIRVDGGRLARL
jgi:glucose 1-dehydrogenase